MPKAALKGPQSLGVKQSPGSMLTDMEYADDIVLLGSSASHIQSMLTLLQNKVNRCGVHFAPSKCDVPPRDWTECICILYLADDALQTIVHLLGKCHIF